MPDFLLDGIRYQSRKLAPKTQLRVLKRLARIAPSLKDASGLAAKLKDGQRPSLDALAETLAPIITAFADMPDDDVEFVIDTCMQATEWKTPEGQWRPVQETDGLIAHQANADLMRSLGITWNVLQDNFASMFSSVAPAAAGTLAK